LEGFGTNCVLLALVHNFFLENAPQCVFHQEDEESLTLQSVAKEGLSPVGNILKKTTTARRNAANPTTALRQTDYTIIFICLYEQQILDCKFPPTRWQIIKWHTQYLLSVIYNCSCYKTQASIRQPYKRQTPYIYSSIQSCPPLILTRSEPAYIWSNINKKQQWQ
jgi:hypothetical protein